MPPHLYIVPLEQPSVKQVVLVRKDVVLAPADAICHGIQAALQASTMCGGEQEEWWQRWYECNQPKKVLAVRNEEELITLVNEAYEQALPRAFSLSLDGSGDIIAAAIGPADSQAIDSIVGHLKGY